MPKMITVSKGGKITIPKELRDEFDVTEGDQLLIEKTNGNLVIKGYESTNLKGEDK